MRERSTYSVPALFLISVVALSCRGQAVYDLNAQAKPDSSKSPPRSSSWKEAVGEVVLPLFDKNDTEYAPGFKEEVFRSVEMGFSQDEVKRRLGEPLSSKTFADGNTCWYYSRHGKKSKSYFLRLLEFDGKGILVARRAEFYVD
jgi:hypothetical protein